VSVSRWLLLGATAVGLLLTAAIVLAWGEWLREEVLRPLAVSWLWLVFYVTHLPQWAVWFFVFSLLALVGLKAMPVRLAHPLPRFRREDAEARMLGPVSGWEREVALALRGTMYRRKLHRMLQAELGENAPAAAQAALDALASPRRWRQHPKTRSDHVYLENLNTVLDALEPPVRRGRGASRAAH